MVKTKQKFTCPECDKEMKNARSLAGHMWFAHNIRYGEKPNLRRKIEKLENEPKITDDVNEKIDGIDDALKKQYEALELIAEKLTCLEEKVKANPGSPGHAEDPPEDPNPDEVKSDEEEDDGLPDLFSKKKKSDDEKKSEEDDDDNSSLL